MSQDLIELGRQFNEPASDEALKRRGMAIRRTEFVRKLKIRHDVKCIPEEIVEAARKYCGYSQSSKEESIIRALKRSSRNLFLKKNSKM